MLNAVELGGLAKTVACDGAVDDGWAGFDFEQRVGMYDEEVAAGDIRKLAEPKCVFFALPHPGVSADLPLGSQQGRHVEMLPRAVQILKRSRFNLQHSIAR